MQLFYRNHVYIIWLAVLLIAFGLYRIGFSGGYLLDDYQNLRLLSDIRAPLSIDQIVDFIVLQGQTNLLGRPLSLLTFAFQYSAWPNNPAAFKLGNLVIHLINATLVFLIAARLGRYFSVPARLQPYIALWSASVWLLHPINVSTVLYVIQRMAQLSAMFMFCAVYLYMVGRDRLLRHNDGRSYLMLTAAVVVTGGAALFSKENGVLTPLLLLVVEATVFSHAVVNKKFTSWKVVFLWLPSAVIFGYLLYQVFLPKPISREFTVYQRLLTEPRVIFSYLGKIFMPGPRSFGLYFDDYSLSKGLLNPWSTFASLAALLGILLLAIVKRRDWRAFSFAVLWFVAAHLLESSSIMLEIYFEHRNYVPLMGLVVALPIMLLGRERSDHILTVSSLLGIVIVGALLLITLGEVRLWANPYLQAMTWGRDHPHSLRAQESMAGMLALSGQIDMSYNTYMKVSDNFPMASSPLSAVMVLPCFSSELRLPEIAAVEQRFSRTPFSFGPLTNIEQIVISIEKGECKKFDVEYLMRALNALLANPVYVQPQFRGHIYFMMARLQAVERNLGGAVGYAEMANELYPRIDIALYQVEWLLSAKAVPDAMLKLKKAEQYASFSALKTRVYSDSFKDYHRRILAADERKK